MVKKLPSNAGDTSSIPGSGRSPGEGNGNPFQYSCFENPMDGGARHCSVHGAAERWTQLSTYVHTGHKCASWFVCTFQFEKHWRKGLSQNSFEGLN